MAEVILRHENEKPLITEAGVTALSARLGESGFALKRRLRALDVYSRMPIPDRVRHLWRYTDPQTLLPDQPTEPVLRGYGAFHPARSMGEGSLVVVYPGGIEHIEKDRQAERLGLSVTPLAQAANSINTLAAQAVRAESGLFEALNTAAWSTGVVIHVPREVQLSSPIRVVVVAAGVAVIPRVLFRVDSGAKVTLIEEHLGGDEQTKVVGISEMFIGRGARVEYALRQSWRDKVNGHLTYRAQLNSDATLTTALCTIGGARYKLDFGVELRGPGSRSEIVGTVVAAERQHFDHHTVHRHRAPSTWSNIHFKAALLNRASSAYTGLIRIEEEATESQAYQEARNLLLSRGCRSNAIPELEILNYEVQCSHGATSSTLDPEHMHYLASRGIPQDEARRLIVDGFFASAFKRVPDSLRPEIARAVHERLTEPKGGK